MTALAYRDFYDPVHDADRSNTVIEIYRKRFPDLYHAVERGEIKTSTGIALQLGGDTLITYKCAIRKIYGKHFADLDPRTRLDIRSVLEACSHTSQKRISCWDDKAQAPSTTIRSAT
jgi:hypothetical protein